MFMRNMHNDPHTNIGVEMHAILVTHSMIVHFISGCENAMNQHIKAQNHIGKPQHNNNKYRKIALEKYFTFSEIARRSKHSNIEIDIITTITEI